MTGATINATWDDQAFSGAVSRLMGLTSNFTPLLKRMGVGLVDTTQHRFEQERDPAGNRWAPLSPAYAASKKGAGILRGAAMRGGLMGSLTFQVSGGRQVAIGSNKIYAAVHQFGAVIKPVHGQFLVFRLGKRFVRVRQVKIPARPYLGFGEADRLVVLDQLTFTIDELLRPR